MQWELPLIGWKVNPVVMALLLGAFIIYKVFTRKRYNTPPGPFALPIIGTKRCVVINNIEMTLEATAKNSTDFAGRPSLATYDYLIQDGKDIALSNINPSWKLLRKIANQSMRKFASGQNLETKVHSSFQNLANVLKMLKEPINPLDYINLMTINFICGFCWGQSYDWEDAEFKTMMRISDELMADFSSGLPEDVLPIMRHCPSAKRDKLLKRLKEFYDIVWQKFEQHRDPFHPDEIRDFIDDLLLARSDAEKKENKDVMDRLTDIHLIQTVMDIFIGGSSTTTMTLVWATYYMVKYQDIQKKVQHEIDSVVGPDRLPGLQDLPKLPYTQGTLEEIMRIDSIAPLGIPHSAMVDSTLGGYDIRKDTMIIFNIWAIHMDPNHWIEPQKFDPNRFLNPDGSHAPKPTSFLPFSAGRRVCLGEAVAKPELLILFACLMQRFTYTLPPGTELPTDKFPGGQTNQPSSKFRLVITPR